MRECNNCFWYENEHTCIFNTLCNKSFNKTGEYKYHIHPYEAKRLLGDILLDMNRMYNRNETKIVVNKLIKSEWEYDCICDMFVCSQCGGAMVRNVYPYCAWCGAEMKGVK